MDRILENQPSPARIKAIKRYFRRKRRKARKGESAFYNGLVVKKSKAKQSPPPVEQETPFLPKVGSRRVVKPKRKANSKPRRIQKPVIKEFEPFKVTSVYGKFMSGHNTRTKFRTTGYSNTATDYTTPSMPTYRPSGVVPSPLSPQTTLQTLSKTKSTQMFVISQKSRNGTSPLLILK